MVRSRHPAHPKLVMDLTRLPFLSSLEQYQKQAEELLEGRLSDAGLDLAAAQLTIARWYDFQGWPALAEYAQAVSRSDSPVCQFESAVETVINGDVATTGGFTKDPGTLSRKPGHVDTGQLFSPGTKRT